MNLRTRYLLARLMKPEDSEGTPAGGEVDSSALSGADVIGTGNADRLAALDRINDANDRARADELQDVNDDDTTVAFVAPVDPDAANGEGSDTNLNGGDEVVPKAVELVPPVAAVPKIKVNGVEVDLTPELIEKAQKIASGDKYLEEAVIKAKTPLTVVPKEESPPPPSQEDVEAELARQDLADARAIQMGTEEEAVAALRRIRSRQVQGPTAEDIGRIADERLTFNAALKWFNTEYKDLVSDPRLHAMVLREDHRLVTELKDGRPYEERYKAIGDDIRAWRDSMAPKPADPPAPAADPLKAKEERKAAAPKAPVAANTKAKPAVDDDDTDETPGSVIAKMAASRGGPQAFR
jgi:hypothetical protein